MQQLQQKPQNMQLAQQVIQGNTFTGASGWGGNAVPIVTSTGASGVTYIPSAGTTSTHSGIQLLGK